MTKSISSQGVSQLAWKHLVSPAELRRQLPPSATSTANTATGRSSVRRILDGTDDRLAIIVGPCSIHDIESTLEYAAQLADSARTLGDDLLVVMRAYFEKPRSVLGWPGMAMVPDPFGAADPESGLTLTRSILGRISESVPVAVEWLNVAAPAYLDDLVSWGCIGARTVESPSCRQLASALSMPLGMKNRSDGDIAVAVNAVVAAGTAQTHLGVAPDGTIAATDTHGNPDCHVVLRGGTTGPNYDDASVRETRRMLRAAGVAERVVIDASHGNSGKDHVRQAFVAEQIAARIAAGDPVIRGVMLESFLVGGRQEVIPGHRLEYGRSITDACMGWQQTTETLELLASAARARRRARHDESGGRSS